MGVYIRDTKNLMPLPMDYYTFEANCPYGSTEWEVNGVVFSYDPKTGEVYAKGTATSKATIELISTNVTVPFELQKNTDYTLSGCPDGGSDSTFSMRLSFFKWENNFRKHFAIDYGEGCTLNTGDIDLVAAVDISIERGMTVDLVFKPMLTTGTEVLPWKSQCEFRRTQALTKVRNPKNLIEPPYVNGSGSTLYGITTTYYNDGVVHLNGTCTGTACVVFFSRAVPVKPGKTYTYKLNVKDYTNISGIVEVRDSNRETITRLGADKGDGATFTVPEDLETNGYSVSVNIYIYNPNGFTLNDLVVMPTLNEGDTPEPYFVTARYNIRGTTVYEVETEAKYNERVTANGQFILDKRKATLSKVVGDTVKCENLFTVDPSTLQYSISFDETTQTLIIPVGNYGYSKSICKLPRAISAGKTLSISIFFESGKFTGVAEIGGYHDVSGETKSWQCSCVLTPNVNLAGGVLTNTVTLTDSLTDIYLFLNQPTDVTSEIKMKVVIAEVSTPFTEYQPHFTGLKSASFGGIESYGRNLFNAEYHSQNFQSTGITDLVFENGKTYTISCVCNEVNASTWLCAVAEDKNVVNASLGRLTFSRLGNISTTFTIPEDGKIYRLGLCRSGSPNTSQWPGFFNGTYCSEIMVAFGTNVNYEPYGKIKAFAFPTTEIPLGTTFDFENKKITNYGVDVVLTGAEKWEYGTNGYTTDGDYYSCLYSFCIPTNEMRALGVVTDGIICSDKTNNVYKHGGWWIGVNGSVLYMIGAERYFAGFSQFVDPKNPTTEEKETLLSEWKAYLAQRYADGNPVTIRYLSGTLQSEVDFTEAQLASGNEYIAYRDCVEKVINVNAKYGVKNTLTQKYLSIKGDN